MTVNRKMHLVPIGIAVLIALILKLWRGDTFFLDAKTTFETWASLIGLVGTSATLIEVLRAQSISAALQSNIRVALERRRASDMTRLVQGLRAVLDLLDLDSAIGARTASDIAGQLRSLYPDSLIIGGHGWTYFEAEVLKLPHLVTRSERSNASAALGLVRNHLEAEISRITSAVDSLPLGSG